MDVGQWWDYYKTLPKGIPADAYDALREKFFYSQVAPQLAQQGFAPEGSKADWMEATKNPRADVLPSLQQVGRAAMTGLLRPIAGKEASENFREYTQRQATESGVGPVQQLINSFVGEGIGMTPYFIPGSGIASGVGAAIAKKALLSKAGQAGVEAAASLSEMSPQWQMKAGRTAMDMVFEQGTKPFQLAAEVPAIGATQAMYDAVAAPDGHRLQDGLAGFAMGAGAAAAVGAFGLRGWLKKRHALDSQEAEAIEASMKGTATEQQQGLANTLINKDPQIGNSLEQWLTENVQKAKKTATPREPIEIEPGSKLSIIMRGADGKTYPLSKLDPANIDKVVDRINQHLEKGGEIIKVNGDATVINKFLKQFENFAKARGEQELPVVIKGADPNAGPLVLWRPDETPTVPVSGEVPKPPAPVSTTTDFDQLLSEGWTRDALEKYKETHGIYPTPEPEGLEYENTYKNLKKLWNTGDYDRASLEGLYGHRKNFKEAMDRVIAEADGSGIEVSNEIRPPTKAPSVPQEPPAPLEGLTSDSSSKVAQTEGFKTIQEVRDALIKANKRFNETQLKEDWDIAEQLSNTLTEWKAKGNRPPAANKITFDEMGPLAWLEQAPDGSLRDRRTGARYANLEVALRANKIRYELVGDSSAKDWVLPNGTNISVKSRALHAEEAERWLRSQNIKSYGDPIDEVLSRGWIRRSGDALELDSKFVDSPAAIQSFYEMNQLAEAGRFPRKGFYVHAFPLTGSGVFVPSEDFVRFFDNPKKYLNRPLKSRYEKRGIETISEEFRDLKPFTYKETPFYHRGVLDRGEFEDDIWGLTQGRGREQKPVILFGEGVGRSTVFHENLHGHFSYLDIVDDVIDSVENFPAARQLANAFAPEVREGAGPYLAEEVVTYLTSAVRTKDSQMLKKFVEADGSMEEVLGVAKQIATDVIRLAEAQPTSLHQRTLIRKMQDVQQRAGSIIDLSRPFQRNGQRFGMYDGKFSTIENNGTLRTFKDRDEVIAYIEDNFREPFNAPNLIDESHLPAGMPRYEMNANLQEPPLTTEPASAIGPPGGRLKGGVQALSFFFRPFYAWLDTVARKNEWPQLYSTFKALDDTVVSRDRFVSLHEKTLLDIFKKYKPDRRHDLYHYLEAPQDKKSDIAQTLNLTSQEIKDANTLRQKFFDPLAQEFGIGADKYIQDYAPRLKEPSATLDTVRPGGRLTKEDVDFFAEHIRTGELDPRDTDLLRVAHAYLRLGARKKFMGPQLEEAAKLVNAKTPEGDFVLGPLQPLFKRHLEYVQGRPDFTQRMVDGAVQNVIDGINDAIGKANVKLPKSAQLNPITIDAKDALGRFILFSYAGTLGARPMTIIRDTLQLFMTTYPMLGGKYTAIGMAKAFSKEGRASEAYKVAEQYGALMTHHDLTNLYSGGFESMATGAAARLSEALLKPMQWSNNSNRLVSFWGHAERAFDAITTNRNNPAKLSQAIGLHYLDEGMRNQFLQEISQSNPAMFRDISYRIAKELTDVSQWNYRRGGHPGTYKYALGRLFGQYGTWPMNYWEYARRITTSGDTNEKVKTITRLAAAHFAILKAGEIAGIDTASWVFTSPMAYKGGPLMSGALNIPTAVGDTQTSRGAEARRELRRLPQISLPGGLAASRVYDAIMKDDPNMWQIMLGFDPLEGKEDKQGLHKISGGRP